MAVRDIFIYLLFGFVVMFSMQWIQQFFIKRSIAQTEALAGHMIKAPHTEKVIKPINTEIDFFDTKSENYQEIQTNIDTSHLRVLLTNEGGCITQINVKREREGQQQIIPILEPIVGLPREGRAFLVALQEKTPYYFMLIDQTKEADNQKVVYQAQTDDATVTKTYIFYQDVCKIDLQLEIEPRQGKEIQPRVFIPAPFIEYVEPHDSLQGIFSNEYNTIKKMKPTALEGNLWIPHRQALLFGAEDRYFINALVADPYQFVQRGYYRLDGMRRITAILEGPSIQKSQTWNLSFYCGPKQIETMAAVDSRLEETLDYGWLSPISKALLYALKQIYKWTQNYGWAIIILTIAISLALWPFSAKKPKGGPSKGMEMLKKLQYVEQKYKHDPEMLAQERKKIYDKYGLMPEFSGFGCLAVVLPLPILFGLNRVLSNAIDLYQAPFIKGWINDLSEKDPYYILPTVIALAMIMTLASSGDPRQRVTMVFVSLMVAGLFASFPAGLALYMVVNLSMQLLKNWVQKK